MSMYGPPGGPYQGHPQDPWQGGQPAGDPYGGSGAYGAQGAYGPDPSAPQDPWGGAPVSPGGYGYGAAAGPSDIWGPPQAPPRRGSGALVGLVVVLALLLVASGGVGIYLYTHKAGTNVGKGPGPSAQPSAPGSSAGSQPPPPASSPAGSQPPGPTSDARTAKVGDCLVNRGTDAKPELHKVTCAPNTFLVLKRLEGTADKAKCDGTPNLTDWYFYDHPTDNQADFVLCLRRR